jgi:cathepsin L
MIKVSFLLVFILVGIVASEKSADSAADYSFEDFVLDHGKFYATEAEYSRRRSIFDDNLSTIQRHNELNEHNYTLGVNQFADMLEEELPMGLDKSLHRSYGNRFHLAADVSTKRNLRSGSNHQTSFHPFDFMTDLSELPESVDWRSKESITTAVKNQGHCGSCWAFAAIAALESHIAIQTGKLFDLSVQELVSCAPNQKACGGHGGCSGSTAEIAYEFISQHGILEEWNFAYQSFNGAKVNCTVLKDGPDNREMVKGAGEFIQ